MSTARVASPETATATLAFHPSASVALFDRAIIVVTTRVTPTRTTVSQNQRKILRNKLRTRLAPGLGGRGEEVSNPPHSLNALRAILVGPKFLSQVADVGVDAAVKRRKFAPQYLFDEFLPSYNAPRGPHEFFQQVEL